MRKFLFLLFAGACTSVSAQQTSSITITRAPQQGPSFFVRQPDAALLDEFNAFKTKLSAYYPVSNKAAFGEYVLLYVESNSIYAGEYQVTRGNANEVPAPDYRETFFYGENYKVVTVELPTSAARSKNYYYIRKSPDHRIDSLNAQLNRNELELAGKAPGTATSAWTMKMQHENDSIYQLISGTIRPEIAELSRFVKKNEVTAFPDSSMNCRMVYYQQTVAYDFPEKTEPAQLSCKRGNETVMSFGDWMKAANIDRNEELKTWANGDYIMVEVRSYAGNETVVWWTTRTYCFRRM